MVTEQAGQGPITRSPCACGMVRTLRLAGPWLTMAAALWISACDEPCITEPCRTNEEPSGIVSNPVSSITAAAGVTGSAGALAVTNVAYVSLPSDSIPNGEIATIRNTRTGSKATTVMADGGFDPVPVAASAGDRLELEIYVSGGGAGVQATLEVPAYRKPRVVRTRPTTKKRDVVLNAIPSIVFTEPINWQTITSASVQLLRNGIPVSGRATASPDRLRAEFQPDQLLAPNTDYVLSVTTGVEDLSGDSLEQDVVAEFTTGTTTALAMVYTDPAALFTVSNGELRAFEFDAILHDDGRVTGTWRNFNPALKVRLSGRVTCFAIVDARSVWVGGIIEEMIGTLRQTAVGMEAVWRAVDHGPPGGTPDQLSYASSLPDSSYGTAEEFCSSTPLGPRPGDQGVLNDVEVGDIVVRGSAPPSGATPLRRFSGGGTVGTIHTALSEPFRVYVLNDEGRTVSGVPIEWAVTGGGGSISPAQDVTSDSHGVGHAISSAVLTLGSDEGTHTATATAPTLPGAPKVTFTATAVTVMVEVRDSEDGGFVPKLVTVPPGKSVAWIYSSGQGRLHNVTFEDDSTQPASSRVLWLPGSYHVRTFGATSPLIRYRCTYHSTSFTDGEVGTITVEDPTPPPPPELSGTIAFVRADTLPSAAGIYVMNADGTGAPSLILNQNYLSDPAWSPDGAKLAFTRMTRDPETTLLEDLDPDVYVMNADGSGVTRLTADASSGQPAWSPDGRRIAFTRGSEIYVMDADGSQTTRLTNNPGQDNTPTWSPDGTKIAFASQRNGLDYEVYVMNADGTQVTRLTFGPGQKGWPAWSPDGTMIAFVRGGGGGQLFLVNADGSGLRQLTTVEGVVYPPSWSPDGAMIAFGFDGPIYAVAVRGGQVTRITNGAVHDGQPAWCCLRNP